MRILALQFRNLNSLRGDHEIRFEEEPLAHAGIFAITGPTGAGKTTILDAITLALYGRAARYDRALPSETMSRHTGECFAEVHFEVGGGRYGARWELRRARKKAGGTLQSPKRVIYDLTDRRPIAEKTKEVDEWVSRHTGLDYQRFLRSVLLAQGDFTAFLKASDKERGQLLEKLTGMEIYAELSRLAHEVAREKRETVSEWKHRVDATDLLEPEERQTKSDALGRARVKTKALGEGVKFRRNLAACLQNWQDLGGRRRRHADARAAFERESAEASTWRRRLDRHRQVEVHASDIQTWRDGERRCQKTREDLAKLEERCRALETEVAEQEKVARRAESALKESRKALDELGKLRARTAPLDHEHRLREEELAVCRKKVAKQQEVLGPLEKALKEAETALAASAATLAETRAWLKAHRQDADLADCLPRWQRQFDTLRESDRQVEALEKRREEDGRRYREIRKQLKEDRSAQEEVRKALAEIEERMRVLQSEQNELLKGRSLEAWEQHQRKLQDRRFLFQTIRDKCGRHRALQDRQETLAKGLQEHREGKDDVAEQIGAAVTAKENIEKEVTLRRELVLRVREIRELREALQEGKPCPVCGATKHPRPPGDEESSGEERALAEIELALRAASERETKLRHEEARHAAHLARLEAERVEAVQEMEDLEEDVALMQEGLDEGPWKCGQWEEIERRASELEREQIREDQRRERLRAVTSEFEKMRRRREGEAAASEKLARELAKREGQLQELEGQREGNAELRARAADKLATAWSELQEMLPEREGGEAVSSLTSLEAFLEGCEERARAYRTRLKDGEALELKGRELRSAVDRLQAQKEECDRTLTELEKQAASVAKRRDLILAQRRELAGARDLDEEHASLEKHLAEREREFHARESAHRESRRLHEGARALHENTRKEAAALTEECRSWLGKLERVSADLSFPNVEELVAACLPPDEARELGRREDALKKTATALETGAAQLQRDEEELLQRYRTLAPEEPPLKDQEMVRVEEGLRREEELWEAAKHEVWDLEQVLKSDAEAREKLTASLAELDKAERELARWQKLDALIGSADGSTFSRFAQSLTLKRLVDLANEHLERLTDRYQIRSVPERDLEIEVIDRYQANAVRSMQSLSGGEGFLASLALALGLAELAGSCGQIESLFIDEGFGTLDGGSLEMALRALESLQAQSKTIGIISHTELLKERIGCQIQVERGQGGVSTLRIVQR